MARTNEIDKAEKTYSSFIGTIKWVVPVIALIVAFVIWLIS